MMVTAWLTGVSGLDFLSPRFKGTVFLVFECSVSIIRSSLFSLFGL